MQKVLIASKNSDELTKYKSLLDKTFDVYCVSSPDLPAQSMRMFDLLLLDHGFSENSGIDYMMEVLDSVHIPILMLAPPDDSKCAIEAIRAGAFNYIVKSGQYEKIFPVAISEAISRFNEQERMKLTIATLQEKIQHLEELLGKADPIHLREIHKQEPGNGASKNESIVAEIVNRFKQGEINLPSIPQINLKFQALVDRGADYGQISELLKQDIAITSKLIMVSNSPVYRGMEMNRTLEQAVSRLGIGVTQQYVNAISNRALYTVSQRKYIPLIERLWYHSLSCAYVSMAVARTVGEEIQIDNDPFILGLLHDIGKLILLQVISELEIRGKFGKEIPLEDVIKIAEAYHGQFGSALLKRWNFSGGYIGVALHHDNLQGADPISKELLIVHFANILIKELGFSFTNGGISAADSAESAQFLKIGSDAISAIKVDAIEYMENVGKILS